jgi:hypothetical protein
LLQSKSKKVGSFCPIDVFPNRPPICRPNTLNSLLNFTNRVGNIEWSNHGHVPHGHPDGSAIELYDTAHLRLDLMDGNSVVHSQRGAVYYVALLTATANSWKVGVLQAVPAHH